MSATLPKIDALHENLKGSFISLISNRDEYFSNQNFAGRVSFDFTLADKKDQKMRRIKKDISPNCLIS
jgi:CRISPR-associated endonuclease/helicase Cas3